MKSPMGWTPEILPTYKMVNSQTEEDSNTWAWKWERNVNRVRRLKERDAIENTDKGLRKLHELNTQKKLKNVYII